MKALCCWVGVAAALWFMMFAPWTAPHVDFWTAMSCSGVLLGGVALVVGRPWPAHDRRIWLELAFGVALAVVLWGVFWLGDKVSQLFFGFARGQVDAIYSLGEGAARWRVGALLLFVIGPAEELFWRGYVQRRLSERLGVWGGFALATAAYTLIHVWSFNFMRVGAAGVCGVCWGGLYALFPRHFPALLLSHALWDVAAFVVFPF